MERTMLLTARCLRFLAFSLLFLSIGSCGSRSTKSTVSTTIGARTVKATIDQSASITTENDTAIVNFGSHQVAIESERVLFDGDEQVQFANDAEDVEIKVEDDRMTVAVDGKVVLDKILD